MRISIVDCYTDEPSGLGVMPYIGTYPRYIFGALLKSKIDPIYLTIDDVRSLFRAHDLEGDMKTKISLRNLTRNSRAAREILSKSDVIIVIAGAHTPGKYLSANPGTTAEVIRLFKELGLENRFKIFTGPASIVGSGLFGGRPAREAVKDVGFFDLVVPEVEFKIGELIDNNFSDVPYIDDKYKLLGEIAPYGAAIADQLPHDPSHHIAEIETMSGCAKSIPCSFCIEKIKDPDIHRREKKDIINEVRALSSNGLRNLRIGKQTCIYSYGDADVLEGLFRALSESANVLHIDNANPMFVDRKKTKILVKYCSPGNVASLGVESFDEKVINENDIQNTPELVYEKISLINEIGSKRGINGMPAFLPGINLLFGLKGESKYTHVANMECLNRIFEDGLMLRRINIREVVLFRGTKMGDIVGNKFLRKNRKMYWRWRNDIRRYIDLPMLQRLVPKGTILRSLRTEIYDGKTTFARQVGTYPLVVGVPGRIGLDRTINVKVNGHMLRSVTGEEISQSIS